MARPAREQRPAPADGIPASRTGGGPHAGPAARAEGNGGRRHALPGKHAGRRTAATGTVTRREDTNLRAPPYAVAAVIEIGHTGGRANTAERAAVEAVLDVLHAYRREPGARAGANVNSPVRIMAPGRRVSQAPGV
jgi:hypothetical protein